MRALALLYHPPSLWLFGGSERRFLSVSKCLRAQYDVEFDAIEPHPPLCDLIPNTHYTSHPVKLFLKNYMDFFEWLIKGLSKAKRLVRNGRYDIVYATNNNIYNFLLGYLISKLYSLPLVVVVHHLRWVDPLNLTQGRLYLSRTYKKMRQSGVGKLHSLMQTLGAYFESKVGRADMLITVSRNVAKNLITLGVPETEIVVTGNAVDTNRIVLFPNDSKCPQAVFVGRLDEGKGICDLIRVWRLVVETAPNAKLFIVGSGLLFERAMKLRKNLGLRNSVVLTGFVQEKNLYRILSTSKVFVSTSKMEGWGIAVAEALTAGLPVVCYDIPCLKENYEDCASVFFCPIDDIKAFAEQVINLLSLPEDEHIILRRTSRSYVKSFDWRKVAEKEYEALVEAMRG